MLAKILIGVAAVLLILLVVIAMQPSTFTIERRAPVAAPPGTVFAQVNDFRNWTRWSPWEQLDPAMERTYGDVTAGEGATYAWNGNNKVGAGNMTIVESEPGRRVGIRLEFLKPFKAVNRTEFSFHPIHGGTDVIWRMTGRSNFLSKAFGLFFNMDKMVGKDFEKGLAAMKRAAEIESGWQKE